MIPYKHNYISEEPSTTPNMKYLTLIAAAATLAVAPPATNSTSNLEERSFTGHINFFSRWDCQADCVKNGMCLSGQVGRGMKGSDQDWIGWDSGCWDRPVGAHSLALSISNGHKFTGISKSCEKWKADGFVADAYALVSGKKDQCNVFKGDKIKAVFYHW